MADFRFSLVAYSIGQWKLCLLLLASMLLAGCKTLPSASERATTAANLGWLPLDIASSHFNLRAFVPPEIHPHRILTIYIEGDGSSWLSADEPSSDPTPISPLALHLAIAQPSGAAAYLARPCQYYLDDLCSMYYWSEGRFSPEVIVSMNQAVSQLKAKYHASNLILVGYSGGATIAGLLAAQRNDVVQLITVAGNMDHQAWAIFHKYSPLKSSLSVVEVRHKLQNIPQKHLLGGKDSTIPVRLAQNWPEEFCGIRLQNLDVIENFNHHCCWAEKWAIIWQRIAPPSR